MITNSSRVFPTARRLSLRKATSLRSFLGGFQSLVSGYQVFVLSTQQDMNRIPFTKRSDYAFQASNKLKFKKKKPMGRFISFKGKMQRINEPCISRKKYLSMTSVTTESSVKTQAHNEAVFHARRNSNVKSSANSSNHTTYSTKESVQSRQT